MYFESQISTGWLQGKLGEVLRVKTKGTGPFKQELMSGEAAKERVTPVPSKSELLTYFRFGSAQCASCGLSPTFGHATT